LYELLNDALQRVHANPRPMAVLYLDLDQFKSINDRLGHAAGDSVLCEFAARLVACKRAGDVASRLSGDEFVLLLEELEEPEGAEATAQRIADAMLLPFSIQDQQIAVGVSIGVAWARSGDSAEELLKRADRALYADKARRAKIGAGSIRLLSGA
jgi:diguanylate cyclase (GGDEF)-like protein